MLQVKLNELFQLNNYSSKPYPEHKQSTEIMSIHQHQKQWDDTFKLKNNTLHEETNNTAHLHQLKA